MRGCFDCASASAQVNDSQSVRAAITIVDTRISRGCPNSTSSKRFVCPCGFTLVTEDAANHVASFGVRLLGLVSICISKGHWSEGNYEHPRLDAMMVHGKASEKEQSNASHVLPSCIAILWPLKSLIRAAMMAFI